MSQQWIKEASSGCTVELCSRSAMQVTKGVLSSNTAFDWLSLFWVSELSPESWRLSCEAPGVDAALLVTVIVTIHSHNSQFQLHTHSLKISCFQSIIYQIFDEILKKCLSKSTFCKKSNVTYISPYSYTSYVMENFQSCFKISNLWEFCKSRKSTVCHFLVVHSEENIREKLHYAFIWLVPNFTWFLLEY